MTRFNRDDRPFLSFPAASTCPRLPVLYPTCEILQLDHFRLSTTPVLSQSTSISRPCHSDVAYLFISSRAHQGLGSSDSPPSPPGHKGTHDTSTSDYNLHIQAAWSCPDVLRAAECPIPNTTPPITIPPPSSIPSSPPLLDMASIANPPRRLPPTGRTLSDA